MARITQFLSRTLPEAVNLPRPPHGGFGAPIAKGLGELSATMKGLAQQLVAQEQARTKAIQKYEQAQQKISDDAERAIKKTEEYQGLGELDDNLQGITDPEKYSTLAKKGLIDLKNTLIKTTKSGIVRVELANDLNPRFERLFLEKYKPTAGKLLIDKSITQLDEANDIEILTATHGETQQERDTAKNNILLRNIDAQENGLITSGQRLDRQVKLLRKIDIAQARRDIEADPVEFRDNFPDKYKNLFAKDAQELIKEADSERNKRLVQEEKNTKDVLLSNLREKASNRQVSYKQLDTIRNEGRLKAGEYSTVRTILDTNLKIYKDTFADQLKTSLERVGEQDKVKLETTIFKAMREFDLRAKRFDVVAEEGNEYYDLMQDMLEKYTPILSANGELIYITPYPEGSIRPNEPQITTTKTTTVSDKHQVHKIWTEKQIISAFETGEINEEEANTRAEELLTKESQSATRE